jgi:hypothetical protein
MMSGEIQHGMECHEFESRLSEALDGVLSAPEKQRFEQHAAACEQCGPMLAMARSGMTWLRSLEEVEPPRNLVRNILVATSGAKATERIERPAVPLGDRLRGWLRPVLTPGLIVVRQPRFALTFAMAFFSLSVVLNAAGVRIRDLRHVDLRPTAVRKSVVRSYYESSARVVRYYENIRLFQQFEAQVQQLKEATRPEQQQEPPKERKYRDDNTSGHPANPNYGGNSIHDTFAGVPGASRALEENSLVHRRAA